MKLLRAAPLPARGDVIGGLIVVVGSLAAATFSMQLWRAHLHIPLAYGSDALAGQMFIKNVISGGWVWTNHSLGAPFGQELFDYPLATDDLNYVAIKLIGFVFSDSARAMNAFFILTFVADGLSAYVVLRWLGLSIPASVVCAILFADAPYHLFRGEIHLLLSSYASVPMGTYLIVSILGGNRVFSRRARDNLPIRRWLSVRTVLTLVLCAVIGSLGVYYAIFTALLCATAGCAAAAGQRSWRPLVYAVVIVAAIGATVFVNDLPSAIYRSEHGVDTLAAARVPAETEIYALKLAEMVFPAPGHRIHALSALRQKYDTTAPVLSEDAQQTLGIVATLGLAWLFAVAVGGVVGVGSVAPWMKRHRQLAFAALSAFLLGTLGGISSLIGYLVTTQIRGWDRISIFIGFFALAAVGLGFDALRRRLGPRRRWWWRSALAAVLVVGIYDQSSLLAIPPYSVNAASYGSDAAFVAQIQRLMPEHASIFQLPYVPYPENPPVYRMEDYDLGRGYIHTTTDLRWSYGTLKGRQQDWASQVSGLPTRTLVDGVVAAGFSGIWVDRFGYTDNGVAIEHAIRAVVGTPPISSRDGRLLFFDLRPYARQLRVQQSSEALTGLRRAILYPLRVTFGAGFYGDESGSRWAKPNGTVQIANRSTTPRRMLFDASVYTLAHRRSHLTIRAPDGTVRRVRITAKPKQIEMIFNDPPGTHALSFTSNTPIEHVPIDPRSLAVRFDGLEIGDASLAPFL
jgi:hypothetical protein